MSLCCRSPPPGSPLNAVAPAPAKGSVTGGYSCTLTVTVRSGSVSGSGTLLGGASVEVLWFHNYTTAISGWNNTAGVLRTGTTTTGKSPGVATIVSPTMSKSAGGCLAVVRNVVLIGYYLVQQVRIGTTWTS
jgi:hypothetical protein